MSNDPMRASRLIAIAEGLAARGSEGLAGIQSLVREMEDAEPGSAERLRARLTQGQIARGLPAFGRR